MGEGTKPIFFRWMRGWVDARRSEGWRAKWEGIFGIEAVV